MDYTAWAGELEIRQLGDARQITGRFPYEALAVTSDRGSVRKERIKSHAFAFAINDRTRRLDLLVGHDFGKPIASRQSGTLTIADSAEAVTFEATLPAEGFTPTWVLDAEKAISNGTMTGLSPGFRVPPRATVPNAESLIPEPGNSAVQIREIRQAVLREMSVVTSGTYEDAFVELRDDESANAILFVPRSVLTWL